MPAKPKPTPAPGSPVRGSVTGRPVMALLDLLGRRWALRLVWELRERPQTFRGLQASCGGVSSSVLSQRLAELRDAGAVDAGPDGYALTPEGRELLAIYGPLESWATRWEARTRRSQA